MWLDLNFHFPVDFNKVWLSFTQKNTLSQSSMFDTKLICFLEYKNKKDLLSGNQKIN